MLHVTEETSHRFRKIFLVIIGILLFFVVAGILAAGYGSDRDGSFSSNSLSLSKGRGFGSISMPAMSPGMMGGSFVSEEAFDEGKSFMSDSPSVATDTVAPASEPVLSGGGILIERKLMQDGSLSLVVQSVEQSIEEISGKAQSFGGRVENVSYDNVDGNDRKRATMVVRVPAVNFKRSFDEFKKSALKVETQNISTRDVTDQFIDLQARLKTLKAEEEQYLSIMQRAQKIEDVLVVTRRLGEVRSQIEQLQGQMNYLSRQVDMSIITLYLSSEPDIHPTNVVWSASTIVKEAVSGLIKGVYGFASIVIYTMVFFLPIIALWGIVAFLFAWGFWKILKKAKISLFEMFRD